MRKGTHKPVNRKPSRRRGARFDRQSVRHARNRLAERYGICLDTAEYWALVDEVKAGKWGMIYRPDTSCEWYFLRVGDHPVIGVYSRQFKRLVSFAPLKEGLAVIGKTLEDVALEEPA